MKISAGSKLILLILGCLELKCIPHQNRSHLGPNTALVGSGEEFHSWSYSGSSGKTGEHRLVVTSAFGLVKPGTHSTVPKSVHFPWPPRELGSACDLCLEGRILVQYAFNASSPMPCGPSGHWSPREAEGKPAWKLFCWLGVQRTLSI